MPAAVPRGEHLVGHDLAQPRGRTGPWCRSHVGALRTAPAARLARAIAVATGRRGERVAPARLLVAVDQHVRRRLEEEHAVGHAAPLSSSSTCTSPSKHSPPRTSQTTAARSTAALVAEQVGQRRRSSPAAGCRRRSSRRPRSMAIAWVLPAPEKPVITHVILHRPPPSAAYGSAPSPIRSVDVAWMSRATLPGRPGTASSSSRLARQEALRRAEVAQQHALAGGPDARQLVEDRALHRPVAADAVVLDREAVRLVADALEQLQRRASRAAARSARRGPGTKISSSRLARLTTVTPCSRNSPSAAGRSESWPLPPSITIRPGQRGEARVARRVVRRALALLDELRHPARQHLAIAAKSSWRPSSRILKRR